MEFYKDLVTMFIILQNEKKGNPTCGEVSKKSYAMKTVLFKFHQSSDTLTLF
jgi:hypothetical protein